MENNFEMWNMVTGEGVACKLTAQHARIMRGYIRQWLKAGMSHSHLFINNAPDSTVYRYFRRYAKGESIDNCDMCRTPMKSKYINYLEDSHGVTLVAACNNCNPNQWRY